LKNEEKPIKFYVKTFHGGSRKTETNRGTIRSEPIDFKEAFVYYTLNELGLCPEVHIFQNTRRVGQLYIATLDCQTEDNTRFMTFNELKKSHTYVQNESQQSILHNSIFNHLLFIDLLSRIFVLDDIMTKNANFDNFGFLFKNDGIDLKIIDFSINSEIEYTRNGIFGGFMSGNGMFKYEDDMIRFVLVGMAKDEKKERIRKLIAIHNIFESIEKAFQRIGNEFQENVRQNNDFQQYVASIKENFDTFKRDLH
jgi:hypothetical protein